jgi:acetyl-CoA C-acetyltransferase
MEPIASVTVRAGCASGLMAIAQACDAIRAGSSRCALAGGFESSSSAPHLAVGLRRGLRLGGGTLVDAARQDGPAAVAVGLEGKTGRLEAARAGAFKDEIMAVEVPRTKGSPRLVEIDDAVGPAEEPPSSRAATDPPLADGAAVVLVASEEWSFAGKLRPLARLRSLASMDRSALEGVTSIEADVTEEAARRWLSDLPSAATCVVNAAGGAADLGHAAGADGARLVVRLVHHLKSAGGGRGLALASGAWGETAGILVDV